jgi:hypothetical protein
MESDSPPAAAVPHPDPEIEALLDFTPVSRRSKRHDGWSAELQRDFIAALAVHGDLDVAAQAVGRTMSGAYRVRKAAGAEEFADAWEAALALNRSRRKRSPLPRPRHAARAPSPAPAVGVSEEEMSDEEVSRRLEEMLGPLFDKYVRKLEDERLCRLQGRIVEADFCVRQLTFLEILLDLGGKAEEVIAHLTRGGPHIIRIAATPMSVLIDGIRRSYWREKGEPERPPLPPLGEHDGRVSTGPDHSYRPGRDGPSYNAWCRLQDRNAAFAAEAQRAWEKKARADAEEWAKRTEGRTEGA